jgi:hypothetical protein
MTTWAHTRHRCMGPDNMLESILGWAHAYHTVHVVMPNKCWACTQCLVEGLGTSAPPYTRACTRAQHARDQERFSSLICLGLSSVPEPISHFKWARAQHPSKIFSGFHTSPLVFHIDLILIILSRIQLRISITLQPLLPIKEQDLWAINTSWILQVKGSQSLHS